MLLEKADVQGYLTTDDLIEVYPEVSRDAERLEAILTALRRRGVDIVDADAEQEPEEDEVLTDRVDYSNLESISSDDTIGL
jgi:RNA polymerase primary sigma factor